MSLECYFISGSPFAWRALLGLTLKGLDFKMIELHGSQGDNKTPEYLAMNPHGKVPVLRDGDFTMYESLAILAYLERKYPETPLFGDSPESGALVWQRTLEIENYFVPVLRGVGLPFFQGTVDGNEAAINEEVVKFKAELARFTDWLAGQDYLAGDVPSAADITLYPPLAMLQRLLSTNVNQKIDTSFLPLADAYPAIAAWMARIEAIDGFDAVYPPHWKAAAAAE